MLPFEASKVPTGTGAGAVWLALQARAPVCITRRIRSVSNERIRWPIKPRILFIAGPDTPVAKHREVLQQAIKPWRDRTGKVQHVLDVLESPKLTDVTQTIAEAAASGAPFTHVHILAHGAQLDENDRYSPVGIVLNDAEEPASGQRLATALTSVTDSGVTRPVVVTLASCDSGQQSDVRTTDASVAHNLHDQGIPLVVASQFPLTVEGSIPFVARFYEDQLWGEHPLVSLYAVRLQLHSRFGPDTHDWASLVVYEALPANVSEQLEELRYWQTRRAQEGALQRLEALVAEVSAAQEAQDERVAAVAEVDAMLGRLPKRGPYALECAGLRAAAHKRIAQVVAKHAISAGPADVSADPLFEECLTRLNRSRAEYWRATKSFLGPSSEPVRRKANLHWLLGQVLSLDVALDRPLDKALLTAAHLAAEIDLESAGEEERAWAYVSLTEFALLRLADPELSAAERERHAADAFGNANRFVELVGRGSEHVATTSRQFARYVDWWGNPELQWALGKLGIAERPHWHEEHGLVKTARGIVELLRGRGGPTAQPEASGKINKAATPAPAKRSAAAPLLTQRGLSNDRSGSTLAIEMLPAANGDCLLIEYGTGAKSSRVLVDCGAKSAVGKVAEWISKSKVSSRNKFELFVLTHIDADHINGVLTLFDEPGFDVRFDDIWFNGWHQINRFLGVRQGEDFSKLLEDPKRQLPWNRAVSVKGDKYPAPIVMPEAAAPPTFGLPGGLQLTLLSPGLTQLKHLAKDWRAALLELNPKEAMLGRRSPPPPVTDFASFSLERLAEVPVKKDPSVANGSSIALLAEFGGRAALLTGDAHADVLVASINALQRARGREGAKLKLDALKLSHHGSANATTLELLSILDCKHYLVSTNGNIFYHPDRESISRVILHGGEWPTLHFNYRSKYNDMWDSAVLKRRYNYVTEYPEPGEQGLRVPL